MNHAITCQVGREATQNLFRPSQGRLSLKLGNMFFSGVIAGANMILVDFHPVPGKALVDGPQALTMDELPYFIEDVMIAREAYEKRFDLAQRFYAE